MPSCGEFKPPMPTKSAAGSDVRRSRPRFGPLVLCVSGGSRAGVNKGAGVCRRRARGTIEGTARSDAQGILFAESPEIGRRKSVKKRTEYGIASPAMIPAMPPVTAMPVAATCALTCRPSAIPWNGC